MVTFTKFCDKYNASSHNRTTRTPKGEKLIVSRDNILALYLLVGVVLLGESAGPDRDEGPLGVLVPDDFVMDEPALDLPADFSCEEGALSVLVVLGLHRETAENKNNYNN